MRRAGYLLAGVLLTCALGYLSWFNFETVELRLGSEWSMRAPLGAQLTFAFLAGVLVVLTGAALRESRRAVGRWRQRRQTKRDTRVRELGDEGRRLLWSGENDRARGALLRAWRTRPERTTLLTLVESYLASDNLQEARQMLQNAEAAVAEDPEVLCTLADVCKRMGDTAGAITALERARGRHARAARVLRDLRDLYIDAARWNEAAAVHTEWLALRPQPPALSEQTTLAGLRYEATLRIPGRDARLHALEELVAHFPRFLPATVSLGDELVAAGRSSEAMRVWEYTFRQQPRAVLAERLASVSKDRQSRERLRTVLRKLRHDRLDLNAVHLFAARLWLEDGQLESAASELEAVGAPLNASPVFQFTSARLSERRGHVERALSSYRSAAGTLIQYHCVTCGRVSPAWQAFCAPCRRWETFRSPLELVRE